MRWAGPAGQALEEKQTGELPGAGGEPEPPLSSPGPSSTSSPTAKVPPFSACLLPVGGTCLADLLCSGAYPRCGVSCSLVGAVGGSQTWYCCLVGAEGAGGGVSGGPRQEDSHATKGNIGLSLRTGHL